MNAYTTISGGGFQPPAPAYDAKGNALTLPRANGTSLALTWDSADRLRTAVSTVNNQQTTHSYTYDPLGRLVWLRSTPSGQAPNDEIWSWSGWTLLAREIFTGSTLTEQYRYTWGPDLSGSLEGAGGVGGLLAIERAVGASGTWDIRHAHADANGNILCLTDSTGTPSARYRYSPFGEALQATDLDNTGWATKNIHGFSTKPSIAGTGLLYYGYRYYDPVTGRWPSRDPIEEMGGVNLYGFVGNGTLSRRDYLGLQEDSDFEHGKCVVLIEIDHTGEHKHPSSVPDSCKYGFVGCGELSNLANEQHGEWGTGVLNMPNMTEGGEDDAVGPDQRPLPNMDENSPEPFAPPDADGSNGQYRGNAEGFEQMLRDVEARAIDTAKSLCKKPHCCKKPEVKFSCPSAGGKELMTKYGMDKWCSKNFAVSCK